MDRALINGHLTNEYLKRLREGKKWKKRGKNVTELDTSMIEKELVDEGNNDDNDDDNNNNDDHDSLS